MAYENTAIKSAGEEERQDRDAAVLAGGTLLSRVLGCLRDVLVAHLLGPGGDAFLVAFRLPNILRRLLAEGSLGMAHAAAFSRIATADGPAAALAFARAVWRAVFLLSLPLAMALAVLAQPLVLLLAPGFWDMPDKIAQAAFLLRCCLPYLPLCCLCAVGAATESCRGNMLPQAFSNALLNTAILCAGLVWLGGAGVFATFPLWSEGAGLASGSVFTAEFVLCMGLLAGGCLQLALLGKFSKAIGGAWSALLRQKQSLTRYHGTLWPHLGRISLLALGAAPHQSMVLAGTVLASFLAPGGISALYFAERLLELPMGCVGVAVGLAALPRLSALAAARDKGDRHDKDAFTRVLADALRLCSFFSLPAVAGLIALAPALVQLLFVHGAFGEAEAARTTLALRACALGLPAMCASRPLLAALSALDLHRASIAALGKSLPPALLVTICCLPFADAAAVGLGVAVGAWLNMAFLWRSIWIQCFDDWGWHLRYALAALIMGLGLTVLPEMAVDRPLLAARLGLVVFVCIVAWLLLFHCLRSPEAAFFARLLRRKNTLQRR